MKTLEIESAIEAILFVSGDPVSLTRLAAAVEMDVKTTKAIIDGLSDKYIAGDRGVQIMETDGYYQLCTNPKYFTYIKELYKAPERKLLTTTLMETLAIVAYKQPVTKGDIEEIRGVNADHAVNKLVEYGLVCEKGRSEAPGRPILFGTTNEFLRYFGFRSLHEIPQLSENLEDLRKEAEREIGI